MILRKVFNRYFFILFLFCFIMLLCAESINWVYKIFSRVNFDEIALVVNSGPGGVDVGLFWSFFRRAVLRAFGWSVVLALLGEIKIKYIRLFIALFAVCFLMYRMVRSNIQTGSFFSRQTSNFYETHYK